MSAASSETQLASGILGTADIVFTVIAVAAPLAVVVGLMPLAIALGNGPGVPGAWAIAMIAMILFALGYVRIIPHVRNAGAFYAYIAASLGKGAGLAAAYVAALCYFSLAVSTLAAFAFFFGDALSQGLGIDVPWPYWGTAGALLVGVLAYHRLTLAAKILGVALVAEVMLLGALVIGIAFNRGISAFSLNDFAPSTVFVPGLGISLIYAFNSLIGIEGTAIYQEEAKNASVTVPRATFISIIVVGLFYIAVGWSMAAAVGSDMVAQVSAKDPGHFVLNLARINLGPMGNHAFSLLVLTSAMAAVLGLFNNTARYVFALARDGMLPSVLARTHPHYSSPHVAAMVLTGVLVLVVILGGATGLDPLLNVSTSLVGLGSVGLMSLLALTSLAIPIYFARRRTFGWAYTVAPTLGGIIIMSATVLAVSNYEVLTGIHSRLINSLPWVLVAVALAGFTQAQWLRKYRPKIYAAIGASRLEDL
ncbi:MULTISPECIES: APC family permease [Novosphingobium]|uniref:APC family permease n=1 Tax=Novosphingobium TaxID=165696 RepID=UPI0005DD38B8|nr:MULTISPECIES: APC family permease [Novosphingobium]CDO36422.1 Amino acid permease-associated region [Novosphingobium sp. KN65.2]